MLTKISIAIGMFTLFATFLIDGHFWYLAIFGLLMGIIDIIKEKDGYKRFFSVIAIILNLITLIIVLIIFVFLFINQAK